MIQGKEMNVQNNPCWSQLKLADVVQKVRKAHGLDLSPYNEAFLVKSLVKRQKAVEVGDLDGYIGLLVENAQESQSLQQSLSIVYSEFFRNSLAFALLEQVFLPHILEEKNNADHEEVRVWSAGCATGQEAWSVAILLDELRGKTTSCRLIATDQSEPALAAARTGVYGLETMGNLKVRHLNRYFSRQGESYIIVRELAEQVMFTAYDLLDEIHHLPAGKYFWKL